MIGRATLRVTHQTGGPRKVGAFARARDNRSTLLLVAAVLLLPGAAPPLAVPVYREFGHWLVACDNTRACVARGFDEATRAQLDLTRAAGAAPATLAFSAEQPIQSDAMRMDGRPIALNAPAWSLRGGAPSTIDPLAVAAFIAMAREARVITLDAGPAGNDPPRSVPLDGFSAALLLVDAVQGRPGTPTALIAPKGTSMAPPGPPLPPAPRWITPPPLARAEAQRLLRQAAHLASPDSDPCTVKDPPEVFPLDATSALAIRPCYMAAYQGSSVVAVLPRAGGPARPVKLAVPGVGGATTDGPDMVDPGFDPATGILSSVSKGRGLADCGSNESWVWHAGAFRLQAFDFQDKCGGTQPGDWPPLYRTK